MDNITPEQIAAIRRRALARMRHLRGLARDLDALREDLIAAQFRGPPTLGLLSEAATQLRQLAGGIEE